MGLISAALNAVGGTLASQWKEYFYVDSLPDHVLATKAEKKVRARFGGSRHEDDNVISDGSVIAVADGQCMMIVDQGKIVEFCAEPGEYIFDQNGEPSLFCGELNGDKVKAVLKSTFDRLSFGGQAGKDQRVYFFNTREIPGNKYGTPSPVPFRVVDNNIGLDVDISIRCFGEYSYRVTNPMLFYANVCGNVNGDYARDQIDSQLRSELLTALQPAFAKISERGIRYSALPGHTIEIAEALNEVLSEKWANLRGVEIVSFGVNSVNASQEDEAMIKQLQKSAVFRNANMAAAHLAGAQAQAMQDAAKNQGGAFTGFMGMNMAQQGGGMNPAQLFRIGEQQQAQAPQQNAPVQQNATAWKCTCGVVATGKFCPECGAKRPAGAPLYRCDKCSWQPADPMHPPKFCPECGDPFDESDRT